MTEPQYTSDWFTGNIPYWDKVFKDLKGKPGIKILEIGSYEGRSARWLLENVLTDSTSHLTCIDPFTNDDGEHDQERLDRFTHNISAWASKVTVLQGFSQDLVPQLPSDDKFDAIYIDGSHLARDAMRDSVLIWPLVKNDGLVLWDDYGSQVGDPAGIPRLGIQGFLNAYAAVLEVIHVGWQVFAIKRGD